MNEKTEIRKIDEKALAYFTISSLTNLFSLLASNNENWKMFGDQVYIKSFKGYLEVIRTTRDLEMLEQAQPAHVKLIREALAGDEETDNIDEAIQRFHKIFINIEHGVGSIHILDMQWASDIFSGLLENFPVTGDSE